jgi:cellulose synthase (UDP-forming)
MSNTTMDTTKTLSLPARLLLLVLTAIGSALVWICATISLDATQQTFLACVTAVVFLICNRWRGRQVTLFLTVLSAVVSLRYIVWRFTETLDFGTFLQGFFGTGLALAEFYAIIVLALGYIQTVWPLERRPVPLPEDPSAWPTVDVYVPTYNEDLSIVRATVLAAMSMDWPQDKLRVYILDDGRRTAFRDFAQACGAGYIIRPDNRHAKAGNLNHAMKLTDGDFIAIFDCDHIPTRGFLQMTLGWLVRDKRLAFIQTPHHFYSPDPFQRNLAAGTRVPAEGNLFYGLVQDGNDFWDAAFFCGSCAVIRREALNSIGGFATETVTEDAHTALRLHRNGWQSAYLRLPLAAGLATERLILHIGQRVRWARGMLQIFRTDNPILGRGLSFGQRICYLNAMMHFLFAVPRIVFLTSPLVFLIFGENLIAASPLAIMAYALPHLFHSIATNARIQGHWRHSFWSEIYETVLALFLVRVTIVTLLNPKRGKFNVTEKGGVLDNEFFDLRAVYPNLFLAAVLMIGLARGLWGLFIEQTDTLAFQAMLLNTIWVTLSLLIVMAALAVGRETRQVRSRARIRSRLPVVAWLPDGRAVQGTTYNLSGGGAALALERPENAPDNLAVDLEFTLGAERLLLSAYIARWERRLMQVSWSNATIDDERKVVQLIFGRADAWTDWDSFKVDRPLASLWEVLVSIRALFRRRGRTLGNAMTAADLPPAPTTSTTLPKRTMILRPHPYRVLTALALLAALLPLAGQAVAQNRQPPLPRMPSVAAPARARSAPLTVPATPPAIVPAVGAAPFQLPSATVHPATTRTVTYSMQDLGVRAPMNMRGVSPIQGVLFGIRGDEVVTEAHLTVSGAFSPSLLPDVSSTIITLNEQYAGTIPFTPGTPAFGPIDIPINPVFFQNSNRLNFRFSGRYTTDCNDLLSDLLWASISDTSTLTLTVAHLPAQRELARLPMPFFDRNIRRKLTLPFVINADASSDLLRAAGIIASWFGRLADDRGAGFPVSSEPPPEGNAVVVFSGSAAPAGMNLPPVTGPMALVVPNPNDAQGSLLVIAGRNDAEVIAAANGLSLGAQTLSGSSATVRAPQLPEHQPYDAPAWIATSHKVRLGELVEASALQGSGYTPGTLHVPFRTAPDLYTWRRRPFNAEVHFRAPPGPIVDVAASRLDLSVNGIYLRSLSLAPTDTSWAWLQRQFGREQPVHDAGTAIPLYTIFGANDFQMFFDARPLSRGECGAIPQDIRMSVDPDSTLDFTSAYHFTQLPNLAFFVSSGYPFTRVADLAETAVVLPEHPSDVELSAYLNLMGHFGSITFQPVNKVTVVRADHIDSIADKDILLISTVGRVGQAASLLSLSPYSVETGELRVAMSDPLTDIWHLAVSTQADTDRTKLATVLTTPLDEGSAAMIGAESPLHKQRSIVAVLAGAPQGLVSMAEALRDEHLVPHIQGDLALLNGNAISAYRVGGVYTELPT